MAGSGRLPRCRRRSNGPPDTQPDPVEAGSGLFSSGVYSLPPGNMSLPKYHFRCSSSENQEVDRMTTELEHGLKHLAELAVPLTILLWVCAIGCVPVLAWCINLTFATHKFRADLKYISSKVKELEKMNSGLSAALTETQRVIQNGSEKTMECISKQATASTDSIADVAHYLAALVEQQSGKPPLPRIPGGI